MLCLDLLHELPGGQISLSSGPLDKNGICRERNVMEIQILESTVEKWEL